MTSTAHRLLGGCFVAAMAAPLAPADATVLYVRSFEDLAREADAVVVATPAAGRRSFWRAGRIFTDVPVSVDAVISGHASAPGTLTVRLPGGTVGDVAQTLSGAPSLDPATPVVLFLSAPRDGVRSVLSLSVGALPMSTRTDGTVVVLPPHTEGLTLLPGPPSATPSRLSLPPSGMSLLVFSQRLREALR